ncbi:hypothetical protein HBH98_068880 [Parastagonospora nodorum]|nr:hypothetical protein HBH53_056030 [Parastagonospora nodorum]KAH4069467.1 hypothetical protein HBH50_099400 [Parastagonospora nodorum]KAH4089876.1 hypothetical protein HBH48_103180 [Parastagonospora nodorum]KAH4125138.1 hypothetical protein HBH47_066160 [Parastagonospora nodorum]KAH4182795.1 hypothetical protein HBH42_213940 [Parastagonospora nodorum]
MAISTRSGCLTLFAYLFVSLRLVSAQRPESASVCDYYAQQRFGTNSSESQLRFMQNVVCLAFEGGSTLPNISSDLTGILRPGKFKGNNIDLMPYFNGSRASTNVNNAAIGINWLDQGGPAPLASFLEGGDSQTLVLANTSNQYHLFSNFFVAFSRSFGCTLPPRPPPNTNGPISLAYAHKFMNLEYNQLGYFISQLALAAQYFGVSSQDAGSIETSLNTRVNIRCAPATSANPPMLLSLCQNPTCPLAVPISDCAAYNNLTAVGVTDSKPTTVASSLLPTLTASSSGTSQSGSSNSGVASSDSSGLSTGGIAGVAVGGAAILLIAVIAIFFFRRKRSRTPSPTATNPAPEATWNQQGFGSPTNHSISYGPKDPHQSYLSTGAPPSEMDTSGYMSASPPPASPDPTAHNAYKRYSEQQYQPYSPPPVEMDTSRTPGAGMGHGPFAPPPIASSPEWQHSSRESPVPVHQQHSSHQSWGR